MDQRVEIHDTTRAEVNGKRGVAIDFHFDSTHADPHSTMRYTVKLDCGEVLKVKPAHVRAEGTGGGGGGGRVGAGAGKAKGNGEKGRKK